MFCDDFLRSALQIATAAVITETRPKTQHFLLRRLRQRSHVRKSFEEPLVLRKHGGNTRLLQHDLRQPDAIGIFVASPRQVPLKLAKPPKQLFPKCREFAALQHDEAAFSHGSCPRPRAPAGQGSRSSRKTT